MVEHCGGEVDRQEMEESESFQASLIGEHMQMRDASEETALLSSCRGETSVDQSFQIPSRFKLADVGGGDESTQSNKKINVSSGARFVEEVDFENERNRMNGFEDQAEPNIFSQKSDKSAPAEILDGVGSLSFRVQDDCTNCYDVISEFSPFSQSFHAQHSSNNEFDEASSLSLNKVVLAEDMINPLSCLGISDPQFHIKTVNTSGGNDIQKNCHQHHGTRDCHHKNLTVPDKTNTCNDVGVCQTSLFEHSGSSHKALPSDNVPYSSSQFVNQEVENTIKICTEGKREHQFCSLPTPAQETCHNVLPGLHNLPINTFDKKTAAELSPLLTAVYISPHVHSPNSVNVSSYIDPENGCARRVKEQVSHASTKKVTSSEGKHLSRMRNIHMGKLEVTKDKAAKRSRRSSKAVKFDECMTSFRLISRKKRSYSSKPARSYIWWSSEAILQSPNIDKFEQVSHASRGKCGSSKSKKVGKKKEPKSVVFGDKTGTPSTDAPLDGTSTRVIQSGSRNVFPDIPNCLQSQTTDYSMQSVKECCGQQNGECDTKYSKSNRGDRPLKADYAFVNSKLADRIPDPLKMGDNHMSHNLAEITHDTIGSASEVYNSNSLQDNVKAVEAKIEFLDPETSPDSEVVDTIPEICLAGNGRAEDETIKDAHISSGYFDIQGNGTNINFTYSSRKKERMKEMPVFGGNCLLSSQSTNSSFFGPECNVDTITTSSKFIDLSASALRKLDSGIKVISTPEHDPSQNNMVSEIKETCSDQIYKSENHFTSGARCVSRDKSDADVPDAWASCDICDKWRRIPSALADFIAKTNCRWTCNDNLDKGFADCSVPQEKSDHAINVELELSDCDEDVDEVSDATDVKKSQLDAAEQKRWTHIRTNLYLHRKRKNQIIDEIMVCHCKRPRDGSLGCGEECLNRMLNIECDRRTCPCGDLCSNQQFQERKYAKLKSFKCGKKGNGLQSEENISRGQFLIEYVGEVLDMPAYEARQKQYALKGHKHFYFMTLNGGEVIDACSKGNLGRYINHSCEPNCRTEKWMVNGEICIGLFAIRNIKKGEEVTFDYNYVRVFGAAAKKCKCGSSQCRGFIGGDLLNCEEVAHDSDEENSDDLEADRESNTIDEMISKTRNTTFDETQYAVVSTAVELEADGESSGDVSTSSFSQSENLEDSNETMHLTKSTCTLHAEELSKFSSSKIEIGMKEKVANKTKKPFKSVPSSLTGLRNDANIKTFPDSVEADQELPRSLAPRNSKISSSLHKTNNKAPNCRLKKSELITNTLKKTTSVSGCHNIVQEKLNELLDLAGGISKRRESPKGYLKLLILTTASDNGGNGEAIQSNRDISMILDALMKTKSRAVLTDIINKNGLRMLHNIMKQYRRDFNRTPILRMLLKILEYLAENKILNSEQINGGPPCPGMESFAESMLELTTHRNKQVYQIARSFRDKWIHRPRPIRKFNYKDEGTSDFRKGSSDFKFLASQSIHSDDPKCGKCQIGKVVFGSTQVDVRKHEGNLASSVKHSLASGSTGRKRKSRWDQDEWVRRDGTCVRNKDMKTPFTNPYELVRQKEADEVASSSVCEMNVRDNTTCDEALSMDEDLPPGFSAPRDNDIPSTSSTNIVLQNNNSTPDPAEVVEGHPQRKFISRSPVAYAIPVSIVDQDLASQNGTGDNWKISPGLPFHPFPPLPMYPCTTIRPFSSGSVTLEAPEGCIPSSASNHSTQRSSAASPAVVAGCRQYPHKRDRVPTEDLRNTFPQPKKLLTPPWMRGRQGQNNPRNF